MQTTDRLTGLLSRVAWRQAVDECLAHGKRFGLVYLDIDRLRLLNSHAGIPTGDQALCDVASALGRLGFPAGRYDGDEFALLVLGGDAVVVAEGAWRAASEALAKFDTPSLRAHAMELNRLYRAVDERCGEPPRAERAIEQPVLGATLVVLPVADHSGQSSDRLLVRLFEALQEAQSTGNRDRVNSVA